VTRRSRRPASELFELNCDICFAMKDVTQSTKTQRLQGTKLPKFLLSSTWWSTCHQSNAEREDCLCSTLRCAIAKSNSGLSMLSVRHWFAALLA